MKNKQLLLAVLCIVSFCTFSINAYAQPCPILGTTPMCYTSSETVTTTGGYSTAGESWTSTNTAVATVLSSGASTGTATVYGVAAGSVTIKYSDGLGNNCSFPMTIEGTLSPIINGFHSVCAGSTINLTANPGPGTWSSANTAIATVDASLGVVLGVAAGVTSIVYTYMNSCGSNPSSYSMTVNPLPNAGTITGPTAVCGDGTSTINLSSSGDAGGNWTSTDNTKATVDPSTGVVTGVSAGSVTIYYSVSNLCGLASASYPITVDPTSVLVNISGATTSICSGSSTNLSGNPPGGTWSSSNTATATVSSSGVVTGRQPGMVTITYTYTNSCGSFPATYNMTVNPLPNPGTISGAPAEICAGSTVTLTDATGGGAWSSSDNSIATVDPTGIVTGVGAGTATISYTVANIYMCTASATFSVYVDVPVTVSPISGTAPVCVGSTISLTDATGGGTWGSSDNTLATVDGSGTVSGVASGNPVIAYSVINACGTYSVTATMTVNPLPTPGSISGTFEICHSGSTSLTASGTSGGAWSSSDATVATISPGGTLYGVAGGTATISYTLTTLAGCTASATQIVTIDPNPNAGTISGTSGICVGGVYGLSSSGDAGGTWSSSNTAVATMSGAAVVGAGTGTATIYYIVTNACTSASASYTVTVDAFDAITGATSVCMGASITLADATPTGTWSSSNTSIATIDAGGAIGTVAAGSVTITYTVTNFCGTLSAYHPVTVGAIPVITGSTLQTCQEAYYDGTYYPFTSDISADIDYGYGTWTTSDASVATTLDGVAFTGGATAGTAVLTYYSIYGCYASVTVTVNPKPVVGTTYGPSSEPASSISYFSITNSAIVTATETIIWGWTPYIILYTGSTSINPLTFYTGPNPGSTNIIFALSDNITGCWDAAADFPFTITP